MKNHNKLLPQCAEKFGKFEETVKGIHEDLGEIKEQITNRIPHSIKELSDKINRRPSWGIAFILTALVGVVMLLLGIMFK